MKKAGLFVAVTLVAVSLIFAGCGGGSKDAAKGPAPAPAKEESVADLFAKGKNAAGMSYDFVTTMKDMKMEGKMWIAGKKMRTEMTIPQKMISIVDGDANVAYTYIPEQKSAMKVALDQAKTGKSPDSFTQAGDAPKYKVVGSETIDGVRCKVLLMQEPNTKSETKMWVREDYGLPARVEISESGNKVMVTEYKNLKVGAVPAETFKLPDGTKIIDMSDMMKNLPKKQ
jgi:outer membrane lipoprotein-sorting protein